MIAAMCGRFNVAADPLSRLLMGVSKPSLGEMFYNKYLIPIAASIWSADPQQVAQFPMRFMAQFFRNHGMLNVWDRPQWRTVVGGSRSYMTQITKPFADRIRLSEAVTKVRRFNDRSVMNLGR